MNDLAGEAVAGDRTWELWRERYQLIEDDVQQLVISGHVFRTSMGAIAEWRKDRSGNYVYGWLYATYMRDAILGIRRQLDTRRDAGSLRKLLEDIASKSSVVNVMRFASNYPEGLRAAAPLEFQRLAGSNHHLPRRRVRADIDLLESAWTANGIEAIAHSRLAHAKPDVSAPDTLRLQDLQKCIGTIEAVCLRYRYLLMQLDNKTLLPANIDDFSDEIREFWLGAPSHRARLGAVSDQ